MSDASADIPTDDDAAAASSGCWSACLLDAALSIAAGVIYFFSGGNEDSPYDYTYRIAQTLLAGGTGLREQPPSWLNEFVPWADGYYYSVFPFGSVVSMVPLALAQKLQLLSHYPSRAIVAFIAALAGWCMLRLCRELQTSARNRIAIFIWLLFGNWLWCNAVFGGAWQIALMWAACGQIAALCCIFGKPRPFLAGAAFALAFGNRTEILLTAPMLLLLLLQVTKPVSMRATASVVARFCAVPFVLGVATLVYNYVRFGSPADFGYAHIPGVLDEPWYKDGIFALSAIEGNFKAMIYEPWLLRPQYPLPVPNPFGSSIFIASPFLLLLFRRTRADAVPAHSTFWTAWISITVLTLVLWLHGNTGGWQYSYRYSIVLLPWMALLFTKSLERTSTLVVALLGVPSVMLSIYSVYLYYWTDVMTPALLSG